MNFSTEICKYAHLGFSFSCIYNLANTCSGTHSITNANSIIPSNGGSTGTAFTVVCSSGYTLNPGNGNMQCGTSNSWDNKPTCDANTCTGTHSITNSASISPASGGSTGTSVSVTCLAGYSLNPATPDAMQCGAGQLWENIPSCDANTCSGTHSIANSDSITPANGGSTGTSVSVTCSAGYSLNPTSPDAMQCGSGQAWENIPSCDGKIALL